jgi:hypothetical protein
MPNCMAKPAVINGSAFLSWRAQSAPTMSEAGASWPQLGCEGKQMGEMPEG